MAKKNILYDLHKRWWWESWLEPANLRWQLLAAAPPASEDLILKAETQSESNSRLPRDFSYLWSIQYEMSVLWVSVSWSLGYIGKHDFTSSCLGWKFQVVSLLWKKISKVPGIQRYENYTPQVDPKQNPGGLVGGGSLFTMIHFGVRVWHKTTTFWYKNTSLASVLHLEVQDKTKNGQTFGIPYKAVWSSVAFLGWKKIFQQNRLSIASQKGKWSSNNQISVGELLVSVSGRIYSTRVVLTTQSFKTRELWTP